ncbi:MAG: 4-hydroxythreonine-4-phosphate dehydrogenase PdxA [Burkholderiaceae bacterium]
MSGAAVLKSMVISQDQVIAITQGDGAGIGPETIAKAFRDAPDLMRGCFVVGDVATLRRAAQCVSGPGGVPVPVAALAHWADAAQMPPRCIPVWQVPPLLAAPLAPPPFGQVSAGAGRVAAQCIRWAAQAALRGEVLAVVTAPVHKEALAASGEPFPGHTELLQAEAAGFLGWAVADVPVRMMLANDELRTVLVSTHLPLRQAIDAVTQANVLQTLHITHAALGRMLGRAPRIAVAGLNPHAGEGGLFGREEIEQIAPAVAKARALGLDVQGPFAPDTVFMRARHAPGHPGEFDVVIAMTHDHGLIPVKYLGTERGVNVTLGLQGSAPRAWRLLRTSPDHGTAFDIAGTGRADASSLLAAVQMAHRLANPPADL